MFWSVGYADFSEIALPNLTVTEANPRMSRPSTASPAMGLLRSTVCKSRSSATTWMFASSTIILAKLWIYFTLLQALASKSPHGIPTLRAFCLTACLPPMKTDCASFVKARPISKPCITTFNAALAEATGGLSSGSPAR